MKLIATPTSLSMSVDEVDATPTSLGTLRLHPGHDQSLDLNLI